MLVIRNKSQLYEFFGCQHRYFRWVYGLISRFYHRFTGLKSGQLPHLRFAVGLTTERISFQSDGLTIAGDFYRPKAASNASTVLLLHGSSIFGRKLSLMKALAREFQQQGYAVLTFDLRGYGESDDPGEYIPEAFDFARDVQSAIDFVKTHAPEFAQHFYVFGHSFGGAVALAAQARDSRIEKIVSFGPPRRLSERFLNPEAREKTKLLVRWQADMQLNRPLNFPLWQQVLEPLNIENYVDDFSRSGHTPVFLIDADHEPEADLKFLRDIYQKIIPPAAYWTVPNTDHYLGTGFLFGIPCYNQSIIQAFVSRIDAWFQQ